MKIKVKKLHPEAQLPAYGTSGAACFDLFAVNGGCINGYGNSPVFGTGLAFEIPEGHVMLVFSRSGHGFKHGVRLANSVGVIDSDYRGEVKVKLANDGLMAYGINAGERIAQAMILPVQQVEFAETSELTDTERGEGGFGSTGTGSFEVSA